MRDEMEATLRRLNDVYGFFRTVVVGGEGDPEMWGRHDEIKRLLREVEQAGGNVSFCVATGTVDPTTYSHAQYVLRWAMSVRNAHYELYFRCYDSQAA